MADGDKKLIIRNAGAGDPTFILNFKVESIELKNVSMKTLVTLQNHNPEHQNSDTFEFEGTFPINKTILMGKDYTKTLWNDTAQAAKDVSSVIEFTFFEDATREKVKSIIEVDCPSTRVLSTKAANLDDSPTVVLHFTSNEETGNLVFLQTRKAEVDNSILTTQESFISCENVYMFTIAPIADTDYCSIYSVEKGEYLGTTSERNPFTFSLKSPDSDTRFQWRMIPVLVDNTTVYQVLNRGSESYLSADPTGTESMRVKMSSESDNTWYLHVPPTD